jgi:hypothetical protein
MEDNTPYFDADDVSADEREAEEGLSYGIGLEHYRKAVVAIIGVIVTVLGIYEVDIDPEIVASVTTLATALLVFFVPNE